MDKKIISITNQKGGAGNTRVVIKISNLGQRNG